MKIILSDLSTALLKFHRGLLTYQTELAEKQDGCKYPPYDLLNLSLNDPRYAWLRKFSELIVQIDTIVDDKKNSSYDAEALLNAVKKTVNLNTPTESNELLAAIKADSSIMIPLGDVRKNIIAFESAVKAQQN